MGRIENPEIEPLTCAPLIFDKGMKAIQWRKDCFFNKWCWSKRVSLGGKMNLDLNLTLYTKNELKMGHRFTEQI